jgi:hypothetical protein
MLRPFERSRLAAGQVCPVRQADVRPYNPEQAGRIVTNNFEDSLLRPAMVQPVRRNVSVFHQT